MTTRFSNLLRAAMEDASDAQATNPFLPPLEGEEISKCDEIIEGTVAHTAEVVQALESLDAVMDEHDEIVATLESMALSLQEYGDAELSQPARMVLQSALESLTLPGGGEKTVADLDGELKAETEQSASSAGARVRETAKKVAQRIWEFLKMVWARLTDMFHRILSAGQQLKFRAKRLKTTLAKYDLSGAATTGTLEVGSAGLGQSVWDNLSIDSVFPTSAGSVTKALLEAQKSVNAVDDAIVDRYAIELRQLKAGMANGSMAALNAALQSNIAMPAAFREVKSKYSGTREFVAGGLPGNWELKLIMRALVYSGVYNGVSYNATATQNKPDADKSSTAVSTQIGVISGSDLQHLPDQLATLADGMGDARNLLARVRKVADESAPNMLTAGALTPMGGVLMDNFHKRYREVGRLSILTNTAMLKAGLALMRWAEASLEVYPAKAA